MKKFFQTIQYLLLRGLCRIIGLLPYWFLYYPVVDFLYLIIYKVVRYRVRVTRANLKNSFPEKTTDELRDIERKFYHHLTEIFIDTILLIDITKKQISRRMVYLNREEVEAQVKGRSWISAMAHYGSWEYGAAYAMYTDHRVLGAYRPLANKAFDRFYLYARSRFGIEPTPMNKVAKRIIECDAQGENVALALIADQTPPVFDTSHWHTFLNQDTRFFTGMAKLSIRYRMPIYFMHIKKIKRGHYQGRFELLHNGDDPITEYEIMKRYAERLEAMIREVPELWMWSHRRWKHKKQ